MTSTSSLSYVIDQDDLLVQVDEGFYRFAVENGWSGASAVLGRSLWEFVAGEDMRKLQRMLVRRVRDELGSVVLPFRCDGPAVKREMTMRIASNTSGRLVSFTARVLAEEERAEPQPLISAEADRGEETLTMCGWCDRFLVGEDWLPVDEAAAALDLFLWPRLPAISHGVCPTCTEMLVAA